MLTCLANPGFVFMIAGCIFTLTGLFGYGYAYEAAVSVYLKAFVWGVMLCSIMFLPQHMPLTRSVPTVPRFL